jgi:hypothetical protein
MAGPGPPAPLINAAMDTAAGWADRAAKRCVAGDPVNSATDLRLIAG